MRYLHAQTKFSSGILIGAKESEKSVPERKEVQLLARESCLESFPLLVSGGR